MALEILFYAIVIAFSIRLISNFYDLYKIVTRGIDRLLGIDDDDDDDDGSLWYLK